ncbi:MAG: PilZ domain-containing protein [Sedimentisphaerales bacterium]|nr:PilZ domain-containing protein [Sedimentisphaerales bacterium]
MAEAVEKRQYRRLDIRLPLDFHLENVNRGNLWHAVTQNVSTGGTYFETTLDNINTGDRLSLALGVDPQDQRFPPEGKITSVGEVVRVKTLDGQPSGEEPAVTRYGIGLKFVQPLKMSL